MPGFDRTGPMGDGPLTGGRRGLCNPAGSYWGEVPGRAGGRMLGRGFRGGYGFFNRGIGRGFGRRVIGNQALYDENETSGSDAEIHALKAEAEFMKSSLDSINKRIEALEGSSG